MAELSLDEWRGWLDANLTAHFITARTFLPVMTHGGSYTFIGGGAAHKPIPKYGAVCIPAAAQLMLVRVLVEENRGIGVRINEVVLNSLIATRERPADEQQAQLTAEEVGRYIAWL
ncbi:MAG: SDR family oxidoreductase, partial [Gemmatimonadaceae bacterium]|nr:SDR family oxidoreductase [Gloeobacterales cyanobacterium ES-bin-141]